MRSLTSNEPVVIIRQGLLRICAVNGCAAAILNDLWYWAIHKQEEKRQRDIENVIREKHAMAPLLNEGIWVYKSERELAEKDLLNVWGWRVVHNALDLLLERGLIQRRRNPLYKWDKTYQYSLTVKALNLLIAPNGGTVPPNGVIDSPERWDQSGRPVGAIPEITTEITTEIKISPTAQGHADPPGCAPADFMEGWNEMADELGLVKVIGLSDTRKKKIRLRVKEHPTEQFWDEVYTKIAQSRFLLGLNGNGNGEHKFKITFDWLFENDTNCVKIAEGRYATEEKQQHH